MGRGTARVRAEFQNEAKSQTLESALTYINHIGAGAKIRDMPTLQEAARVAKSAVEKGMTLSPERLAVASVLATLLRDSNGRISERTIDAISIFDESVLGSRESVMESAYSVKALA